MDEGDGRLTDRRIALAREWEAVVDEVRGLPGFEDFLRLPSLDGLLEAASAGPVVIVNVSRWRCDALMVTTEGVHPVPLRDVTASDVVGYVNRYLAALNGPGPATADRPLSFTEQIALRKAFREQRSEAMSATMEWLWDAVAEPVLADLGIVEPAQGDPPRLWWCPTGLLSLLPLHGAGYHALSEGRTVLDRVISSYTPTLRVLREARRAHEAGPRRMLFVGVPTAADEVEMAEELNREKNAVATAFPGGFSTIDGPAATVQAVADALSGHRWIHVSCHGYQNVYDPSRAGFELVDGTLAIPQITRGRYSGEFAFLSACMTATGGVNLSDEAITLAAALHYSGYQHVVATLWKVPPAIAARVTELVYPALARHGGFSPEGAAKALHDALLVLRGEGARLDEWLPFTHTGP